MMLRSRGESDLGSGRVSRKLSGRLASCPNDEKRFSLNVLLKMSRGETTRATLGPSDVCTQKQFDLAMVGNAERVLNVHSALTGMK